MLVQAVLVHEPTQTQVCIYIYKLDGYTPLQVADVCELAANVLLPTYTNKPS